LIFTTQSQIAIKKWEEDNMDKLSLKHLRFLVGVSRNPETNEVKGYTEPYLSSLSSKADNIARKLGNDWINIEVTSLYRPVHKLSFKDSATSNQIKNSVVIEIKYKTSQEAVFIVTSPPSTLPLVDLSVEGLNMLKTSVLKHSEGHQEFIDAFASMFWMLQQLGIFLQSPDNQTIDSKLINTFLAQHLPPGEELYANYLRSTIGQLLLDLTSDKSRFNTL